MAYLGRLKDYSKKDIEELREKLKRNDKDLVDYIIKLSHKRNVNKFKRTTDRKKVRK